MPGKNKQHLPGTYGLVLCGGRSSRMGTDKSLLTYEERPQRYHVYEMLQPLCETVFISGKEEQRDGIERGYELLTDHPAYHDIGPMAALLTAFTQFPQKNMLLVGCDYPFLTAVDIRIFLAHCKGDAAVSFYNEPGNLYEPLLAWYPYRSFDKLKKMEAAKEYSLQHFLKVNRAVKFYPANKKSITSIDTHEDYMKASAQLIHDRRIFF
jgi:molybdenum cofactor guanylyltransferase